MINKKLILFLILSLTVVIVQGYRVYRDAGIGLTIEPIAFGSCVAIEGPAGPEDIAIDDANGVAFISADDRRFNRKQDHLGNKGKIRNGDIWLLDLKQSQTQPIPLNVDVGPNFHPHGIDLLTLANGQRELYVISHLSDHAHEVIIFNVAEDHRISLKRRVTYPEMISPNDIVALGHDRFFVSNDHGSPSSSIMHTLEDYLGLSRSSVSYFDGENGSFLFTGIKSANGVEISEDQQTLYVAEVIGRSVRRYERTGDITQWKLVDQLKAGTAVDNLSWLDQNTLLAGAHPKLFDFLAHAKDQSANSPSEVISIDVSAASMNKKTIYMNDGSEISGASVATAFKNQVLIGAVFENFFLRCTNN